MTVCLHCQGPVYGRRNKFCSTDCYHAHRKAHNADNDPIRHCAHCGEQLVRRREPRGTMEGPTQFSQRRFCSKRCGAQHKNKRLRAQARREVRRRELRTRWLLRRYAPLESEAAE